MLLKSRLIFFTALIAFSALIFMPPGHGVQAQAKKSFVIAPYLQLGDSKEPGSLMICWACKSKSSFTLEYKQGEADWKPASISEDGLYSKPDTRFFQCKLTGLKPSEELVYRISSDSKPLFESKFQPAPADDAELNIALLGDISCGGKNKYLLSEQIAAVKPNLLMLTGDLNDPAGTVSAYLDGFFRVFNNADGPEPSLMSKTMFVATPGDRDIAADKYDADHDNRKLDAAEGSMAYFTFWKQPLNGPGKAGEKNTPVISASPPREQEFLAKAGKFYPTEANFSFDWGDTHWLVLDGAAYVDWRDEQWRDWVRNDLKSSKKTWNFVCIHQPGFSSDTTHGEEQRMRLLADLFEQGGVDFVFSGHSNSYQRSCPLHFAIDANQDSDRESKLGFVYGKYKLDKSFDGITKTHPDGVIYVISGGGGAEPAERRIQDDATRWQPFTRKFYCEKNSFSLCRIKGKELELQQIADDGKVIDSIKVSK